ncbi:MAG: hypothetical protein COZ21_06310 [Bacteroidetes bacterium CG_4_10_14_3_um_filter_31_20]|nr:hypothetical protein [Bacteroidota bacterium]PIX36116.1 MAG: hypothetical protein COZ59_02790 [Bacteroidetes bacterium CG_4_8_14_3_um_filter_31_14]PIY04574.1 MAG: hypothetical protein COZ21_06310 [Bacteroidetes bacterium CG_4_10_14_3_um_filter_31_20]
MSNGKEDIILSFILGFLAGIAIFSIIDKKNERRVIRFNKIKDELDKGFKIDRQNIQNDWQHIYFDLDKSFKKLKQDTYETV